MSKGKKQNKQYEENKQEEIIENVIEENLVEENIESEVVEEIIEPKKTIRGTVICDKLNVRKEANKDSEILTVIPKDLVLTICDDDSSPDFYKVLIGEIEGYCMKNFIAIIAE